MSPATTFFAALLRRPHHHHHLCRGLSTHSQPPSIEYSLTHPIYTIWAANTSLGKTLVSAGLSTSFLSSSNRKFLYLKPVQTGFPYDSDSRFVYNKYSQFFSLNKPEFSVFASNHVLRASVPASNAVVKDEMGRSCGNGVMNLGFYEESRLRGTSENGEMMKGFSMLVCKTMYGWKEALSPHLVAERENARVEDAELLEMLKACLEIDKLESGEKGEVFCVIETAGGVASPGPSGSLQCDLYRPFRFPAILVGDGKLGGISGTISAYESLKLRGYDVVAVVVEDHGLANEGPLSSYLRRRVPVLVLPPIPKEMSNNLMEWFQEAVSTFHSLQEIMQSAFLERASRLRNMPRKAHDIFWWPFTQHKLVPEEDVTVIDSRCGENFAVHKVNKVDLITQQFDACASWWTQGPDATLQIELARDVGYATARYGHVMFPENVYEPALECAELLLEGVGKGWASRVYFSDNGSTAIEIALKMALRKFLFDHRVISDDLVAESAESRVDLKVLALRGSYHGDTLGAMEAQAPSPYTGFYQQPWYKGRGHFLDPPTVAMCDGVWKLSLPQEIETQKPNIEDLTFSLRENIFKESRDNSNLSEIYHSYIRRALQLIMDSSGSTQTGALIIEPVVQGAGGMEMVDPLFQRVLVKECRSQKIPVIFDEVFTGFWRLGAESATEFICCKPDIACYAKLMTGGIVPLAVTLASEAVFEAFVGDSKLQALLHGHSYTAHAIGCTAAVKAIKWFKDSKTNPNLISEAVMLRELWDSDLVRQISLLPAVHRVVVLGTLCALELRAEGSNAGYASLYARSLIQKLREDGIYMRPLGNVIYLMCGPCTSPESCSNLLNKVYRRLEEL
ncbi:PREDICTED: bifunctional dethiobiotin synthetase/7,8-diamino-pelargonic acid aminotransferase, mitochondrial [Nicotiana attenuata]|uniref:Bifunctional dethiobiotin synthetase7,8-diamino-pelargonic acid aminotransferase, mitochondrial n=1 Tax=Nicotiana attenuata TaxID=49451 RepID=A0A1J6HWZ0_NICAT|nr:PREDICTED: bifunctional dethiobiotin synthetase/7,8-diamino-pelargonic acid aminotransferase, mitochondrial [Nicotiana attenuata]OIS97356.1 bifunctional dethiobiotin synthetase7,8-diamino-pelargonic acid aminotransferase, mitochondrial [Nicotiana attenuata]